MVATFAVAFAEVVCLLGQLCEDWRGVTLAVDVTYYLGSDSLLIA
jgi:hypothetical protein